MHDKDLNNLSEVELYALMKIKLQLQISLILLNLNILLANVLGMMYT